MTRRFIVFGAGAIGGVVGAQLIRRGVEVVLIARGAHADALESGGLRLEHGDDVETFHAPVARHASDIDWRDDDVVFLAVKSQDTLAAVRDLAAVAPASIAIVCAQNGVDNERVVLRHFAHVYVCVVMMPTAHLEPGVVQAHAWPIPGLLAVGCYPAGVDKNASTDVPPFPDPRFN